jgi:hypothetical protein
MQQRALHSPHILRRRGASVNAKIALSGRKLVRWMRTGYDRGIRPNDGAWPQAKEGDPLTAGLENQPAWVSVMPCCIAGPTSQ